MIGGEIFTLPEEREMIIELLKLVQDETGWPTASVLKACPIETQERACSSTDQLARLVTPLRNSSASEL